MKKNPLRSLPQVARWSIVVGLIFFFAMSLLRLGLYWFFPNQGMTFPDVRKALWLGVRYDLRIVAVLILLIFLPGLWPGLDPFRGKPQRKGWRGTLGVISFLFMLFYAIDFAHFSYLGQRLNASVLNYLADTQISFTMVWESYPILRLLGIVLLVAFLFSRLIARGYKSIAAHPGHPSKRSKIATMVVLILVCGGLIFGRFNQYPLRWSDAFALGNDYKANLALNPFESFFNSLKFRKTSYDLGKLREGYPLLADYLGLGTSANLNFTRNVQPRPGAINSNPNIVLVLCESFSGYKSSMWGNPLNTTPFFDSLTRNGLFFDHCFTPTYGTARGVWATITGIPDVEMPTTASRNPLAVNQRTIINEFTNLNKFYFLGGSSSWANIRGLLTNNIEGLRMYEEDSYKAPRIDVWGISDKNLFLEANAVLAQQDSGFFAIIQTADNHRPYTIPEEDRFEFELKTVPVDSLRKYGFESLAEYNAFRYTDFCFQKFMQAASKEKYYANTIFVFVGDHGIPGDASAMLPRSWTDQRLTAEHVPLLFYAPGMIAPGRSAQICSQIDILPTIAGLVNMPYVNSSLGRDLLDTTRQEQFAFIFDPDYGQAGVVMEDYFYRHQLQTGKKEIVSIRNNDKLDSTIVGQGVMQKATAITNAFHEAAKYLILNNKKP